MTRSFLLVSVVSLLSFGCRTGESTTPRHFLAEREADALILDVRTPAEYASGHLVGAVNVNLFASDFEEQVAGYDRDRPVYLYCGSGARSGRAAAMLEELGFEKAVNIGGYRELKAAGAEVVE